MNRFLLITAIVLALFSCQKDDEVIVDNGTNDTTSTDTPTPDLNDTVMSYIDFEGNSQSYSFPHYEPSDYLPVYINENLDPQSYLGFSYTFNINTEIIDFKEELHTTSVQGFESWKKATFKIASSQIWYGPLYGGHDADGYSVFHIISEVNITYDTTRNDMNPGFDKLTYLSSGGANVVNSSGPNYRYALQGYVDISSYFPSNFYVVDYTTQSKYYDLNPYSIDGN